MHKRNVPNHKNNSGLSLSAGQEYFNKLPHYVQHYLLYDCPFALCPKPLLEWFLRLQLRGLDANEAGTEVLKEVKKQIAKYTLEAYGEDHPSLH